ncbi:hypothetical protein C2U63_00685 [Burkholderia pseudomallei]|nr:conserved domain protein [Burkholderia pseudomallei MSHR346]AUL55718.1 hypothetical protein BHT10_07320 [Burkholderia pseudomallei]NRE29929.1 hypothetical protein [Burkholderia pseudomallei]QBL80708.1 hypothetical protein EYA82_23645 [Burkholderia pseudomallei]QBP57864.1 hypothetical protein E2R23_23840 [Burkholderia pseudomallei]
MSGTAQARFDFASACAIRRAFAGFHIESVPIQYTVGGAKGVERRERITFSWGDSAEPVGLFGRVRPAR